jgi:aminoglycoside phosphotransferase (APT) family kinase protein
VSPSEVTAAAIRTAELEQWFADTVPGVARPLHFELVPAGRSNLTFRVVDEHGRAWVLRRPPLGGGLPTAHDVVREYRIIAALAPTGVPVAGAVGCCEDPAVTGAPFAVFEYVDGTVVRDATVAAALTADQRRRAGEDLVDVLARTHQVDVDAHGLADLGRRDGYVTRQLRRWRGQYDANAAEIRIREIEELYDRLVGAIPLQPRTSLVHGDYRLDNTIIGPTGEIRAVLDWEIATLGDPLADAALLLLYWIDPGEEDPGLYPQGANPFVVGAFPSRAEAMARYEAAAGLSLASFSYYLAFAAWRLACVMQTLEARYRAGRGGGDAHAVDFADRARRAAELAVAYWEA